MEVVTDCSRETPRAGDVTKGGLSRLSVTLVVVVVSAWSELVITLVVNLCLLCMHVDKDLSDVV